MMERDDDKGWRCDVFPVFARGATTRRRMRTAMSW
jgi:hypothetical protein